MGLDSKSPVLRTPAHKTLNGTSPLYPAERTRDVQMACLVEPSHSPLSVTYVQRTWGRRCTQFFQIPPKSGSTLQSLQDHFRRVFLRSPRPDYVLITSSDSYIVMENLKKSLLMHDFNDAFFIECSGRVCSFAFILSCMPPF
ncbi:unnamed protein product [Schistocephalus solidus]|uniref:Ras-associating domain-containing protein n=1 Tax=Schistocephalus solidus TaxID=70667 RepID=A0A183S8M1_SCHSO|nr:unnamed protein product [Schistocephalus solidus]